MTAARTEVQPMTVRFRTGYLDLYRALRALDAASSWRRRLRHIAGVMVLVGIVTLAMATVSVPALSGILTFVGLFCLFMVVFYIPFNWVMPAILAWLLRRKNPLWRGEQEITFTGAGVHTKGATFSGFMRWDAIVRQHATERFLLLYASDMCGIFVPRSAFPDGAVASDVAALIRERAGQAPRDDPSAFSIEAAFPGPMRAACTFEIDPAEVSRATMAVTMRTGVFWVTCLVMLVMVLLSEGPTTFRQVRAGGWSALDVPHLLWGLLPLFIFVPLIPLFTSFYARRQLRSNPSAAGPQTLRFYDDGIETVGAMYNGRHQWTRLSRVVETSEFLLFFSGMAALYLPKRAAREEDLRAIRALAARHVRRSAARTDASGGAPAAGDLPQ